jgi:hypothetical protein
VASVLSVAQTTVLIGVNPCLTGGYLKKQSQFRVSYFVCGMSYVVFRIENEELKMVNPSDLIRKTR